MAELGKIVGDREIVVVANRLPVDRVIERDGTTTWRTSPGGLVSAMEPVVQQLSCRWIGWAGSVDEELTPFSLNDMRLIPVPLSEEDLVGYYEGFSNGTLWPLYHDVIAAPEYHREWWDQYEQVNRRFAEVAAREAPQGAIVWVHDYQLQLVPAMLRELRPDLIIVFFLHIPFPAPSVFAQLPWRRRVIEGLLGADVVGFQREQDAVDFRFSAERYAAAPAHGNLVYPPRAGDEPQRSVLAQEFPISIDSTSYAELAARADVQARAEQIRDDLGDPKTILLGVDRLDYTKGIRHRLKAFSELLNEGEVSPDDVVLVQVASPSRERVAAYRQLRGEVEKTVSRINGDHGSIGQTPVVYLHKAFSRDEMAALYLASDVLVVSSLRDGMNLVAKEYAASRADEGGVLLLSEFAGAADELQAALRVNPHDIEGMKAAILRAIHMPEREQYRRMRALGKVVRENDVHHWAKNFLIAAASAANSRQSADSGNPRLASATREPILLPNSIGGQLRRLATSSHLIVACDFDGTLSPLVSRPADARILDRAQRALTALQEAPGVQVALLSGRSLESLLATGVAAAGWVISGSHGAELIHQESHAGAAQMTLQTRQPSAEESDRVSSLQRKLKRVFDQELNVEIERKPFGVAVHTRRVEDPEHAEDILDATAQFGSQAGFTARDGKRVREFSIRQSNKGDALSEIRSQLPAAPVLFLGDDVTDEDVFRTLRVDDLGVKVGAGDTAASERVPNPNSVAALLARLVELRTGRVIGDRPGSA